ncbi:hypothetical protein [Xanthomonas sontii]|uniref:hypothetical protein n=1 Tax=Xanthomonas sontii TaxID=2650745 RepID=UPI00142F037F|nr:hypothetical protein [Xanthomonas sontii]
MSSALKLTVSLAALGLLASAGEAAAQCCPSGGSGSPGTRPASAGLGEATPKAANLSASPRWSVYEFSREGVTYYQINDAQGIVRAAVGQIGDTVWVMPMGRDVDRVSVSSSSALGTLIYETDTLAVRVLEGENGPSWIVVPRAKK